MHFKGCIIMFFVLFLAAPSVKAHPHVFIEYHLNVHFDQQGIEGFELVWTFDRMFSQDLIGMFDGDENLMLDEKEQLKVRQEAFANLKTHGYFLHVRMKNKVYPIQHVKDFEASIEDGCMVYRFYVPFSVKAEVQEKTVDVYVYDESYYMDVEPEPTKPVRTVNSHGFKFSHQVAEDTDKAYYFEQIYPYKVTLKLQK